jgi:hypothetical protein
MVSTTLALASPGLTSEAMSIPVVHWDVDDGIAWSGTDIMPVGIVPVCIGVVVVLGG